MPTSRPTLLTLFGVPVPPSMTGRAVTELLAVGPVAVVAGRHPHGRQRDAHADGGYQVDAHLSTVAGHRYLDHTEVRRR